MRKLVHMDDESVEHLCNAIIGQAIKDYTTEPDSRNGCDARLFFTSDWFFQLSGGAEGDAILAKLNTKLKEFQELCQKNRPRTWRDTKEANQCIFSCPFCGGKVKIVWGRDSLKGFNARTYVHQCEVCGVRQTYEFNGNRALDLNRDHQCKDCVYFKPSRGRHFSCKNHNSYTAPTSCCSDWQSKEE